MSTRRLRRVLAVAVREDDAVGDHRRIRLVHVARHPGRRELHLAALLFQLERGDRAVHDLAVLDRRLELRVLRPPERQQHPARAVGVFPRRDRAPRAGGGEVHLLVADQRRAMTGVRWSSPPIALVSSSQMRHSLLDCTGIPCPCTRTPGRSRSCRGRACAARRVRRRVPVAQLERLGRRVLLHRDDRLAEDLFSGK